MPLPRRHLLLSGAALMNIAAKDPPAAAWLAAWDGQGIHRTATDGDARGAAWLAETARALGATVEIESFGLSRIDPIAAFVEVDGETYQGEMLFDAPDTPPVGVTALASADGGQGLIALSAYSPRVVYAPDFVNSRRASVAQAAVIVTTGDAPGLALLNAEAFNAPFGPPTVQVPSQAHDALFAAALRGAAFRVVVQSRRTRAEARNIVVTVPGRDHTRPPVVVMTPRSSWFQSTAERGGGLVCWLEALRAVLATPPECNVIFTANSGHELGHIGLDAFMATRPGWEKSAVWVHFGANIGAAGGKLSVVSGQADMAKAMTTALSAAGQPADQVTTDQMPFGESRDIHRAGGRYVTLVGSNKFFHLPQDRYPGAVDVGAITRIAAGAAQMVLGLAR
jgi:hypothetical protein